MPPHIHPQYEVGLIIQGDCACTIGEQLYQIPAGSAYFVPNNVPHATSPFGQNGFTLAVMHFPALSDELLYGLLAHQGGIALSPPEQRLFRNICAQIEHELASGMPFAIVLCQALVIQVAVLLYRCCSGQNPHSPATTSQRQIVNEALRWLNLHFHRDVKVEDLAKHIAVTPAHLRRLFRRQLGIGPKEYLTNMRLEKAKGLLLEPGISIRTVAQAAGFNLSNFSRVFRARVGVTPSKYREMHANSSAYEADAPTLEQLHRSECLPVDRLNR